MAPPIGGIPAGGTGGLSLPLELLNGGGGTGGVKRVADGAGSGGDGSTGGPGTVDFASILKTKLGELGTMQADGAAASEAMATGRVDDVAQTLLRVEQASISLQYATQVRNKVIESYQEIMRMQM